ncbi:MAG: hypothetical protein HWN81_00660 [Candidatus Lokiarchaeota archaeon]|nr:hypothetical protein [Candidatus Lokiarchaeota archaeon]
MTEDMRQSITSIICESFKAGEIDLKDTPANKEKLADDSKLKAYVSGLVSNWYRKDKRFNGNVTYVAANPGSRAGQGDSQMKNLRLLKKQFEAAGKETKEIDAAIEKRSTELKAAKAKDIQVDLDKIPAELRASLGLGAEDSE